MKLNETQMKHADSYCPICKTSEHTLYDEFHGESYCCTCGLVLQDSARKSIVELIEEAKKREHEFRNYLNRKNFK